VSVSAVLYPRWPPLLKIEISSNGQNASILYFSNLGTFWLKIEQFWPFEEISIFSHGGHLGYRTADRLCKLEKRGDEIFKKSSPLKVLSQSQPNFAEMILGWSPFKIVSVSSVLYPRWPPLLKIEISSNDQNCSILSHYAYTVQIWALSGLK
jgi:hypothetical protein